MVDSVVSATFALQQAGVPANEPLPNSASAFDLAHFNALYQPATPDPVAAVAAPESSSNGFKSALKALDSLNAGATDLGEKAQSLAGNMQDMTPGDMLQLTMHAHHFVFQAQLTANVANRTSEGIQQLFRQQS